MKAKSAKPRPAPAPPPFNYLNLTLTITEIKLIRRRVALYLPDAILDDRDGDGARCLRIIDKLNRTLRGTRGAR